MPDDIARPGEQPVVPGREHEPTIGGMEDLGREEINARYFLGRADGFRVRTSLGRLLCARLTPAQQ